MTRRVHDTLRLAKSQNERIFSILIDPEKCVDVDVSAFAKAIEDTFHKAQQHFDIQHKLLLVGGSTVTQAEFTTWMEAIGNHLPTQKIIFPGAAHQIVQGADALLFLSLLSGNNPDFLINEQRKAARQVSASGIESIPTAYILLDGGTRSAVERVTDTSPIDQNDIHHIVDTCLAAELLGFKNIYLEAGSGALYPVRPEVILEVSSKINLPLIVGGGLRSKDQILATYQAGANMVVVGTAVENDPDWAKKM